jgi:phosphatidylglycerol:prolipoprotein diacylglycerol transferase
VRPLLLDLLAPLGRPFAELLAPGYFTFVALAAIAGALLCARAARREGLPAASVLGAVAVGYAAAVAGGILAPMLVDLGRQLAAGGPVRPRWAGMIAYGGFVFGFLGAGLALRRHRIPFARFAEIAAAPLGLAIALVRVGCFVAGCDHGEITGVPWAVRFPAGSPAFADHVASGLLPASRAFSLPVHPTQLYEAALGLLIFAVCSRLRRRRFLCAVVLYAAGRIAVEALRGDQSRGVFAGISTSQILSLAVLAGCALALLRSRAVAAAAAALLLVAAPARADRGLDLGLSLGTSVPTNRRGGQVPASGVYTFGADYTFGGNLALGLVAEGAFNEVATHTTLLAAITYRVPFSPTFEGSMLFGLGSTVVNFRDESFGDERAFGWRFAGGLAWALGEQLAFTLSPIAIDVISEPEIGGPIVSFQLRIGLSWGTRRSNRAPPPAPQAYPPPPAYPPRQLEPTSDPPASR